MYSALNYYVFYKVAWDNATDVDALVDEYNRLMFSPAADYGDDISPVQGHTVVRVPPGGSTYQVLILDASDESMRVIHSRDFSSRPADS